MWNAAFDASGGEGGEWERTMRADRAGALVVAASAPALGRGERTGILSKLCARPRTKSRGRGSAGSRSPTHAAHQGSPKPSGPERSSVTRDDGPAGAVLTAAVADASVA